jgi:hypothetical protein
MAVGGTWPNAVGWVVVLPQAAKIKEVVTREAAATAARAPAASHVERDRISGRD